MILPIFPLSLLIVAFGSIVLYQRSTHELTRMLSAGTAAVCLIWAFVVSHWFMHILSLVLLFSFGSYWLKQEVEL